MTRRDEGSGKCYPGLLGHGWGQEGQAPQVSPQLCVHENGTVPSPRHFIATAPKTRRVSNTGLAVTSKGNGAPWGFLVHSVTEDGDLSGPLGRGQLLRRVFASEGQVLGTFRIWAYWPV